MRQLRAHQAAQAAAEAAGAPAHHEPPAASPGGGSGGSASSDASDDSDGDNGELATEEQAAQQAALGAIEGQQETAEAAAPADAAQDGLGSPNETASPRKRSIWQLGRDAPETLPRRRELPSVRVRIAGGSDGGGDPLLPVFPTADLEVAAAGGATDNSEGAEAYEGKDTGEQHWDRRRHVETALALQALTSSAGMWIGIAAGALLDGGMRSAVGLDADAQADDADAGAEDTDMQQDADGDARRNARKAENGAQLPANGRHSSGKAGRPADAQDVDAVAAGRGGGGSKKRKKPKKQRAQ